jgi:purine nucleosidase
VINDSDIAGILGLKNEVARFAIECNSRAREAYLEQTGEDGISLPDPVAMSIALDPNVGSEWSEHHVEVETRSELTRGMTVVDRLNVATDERNQAVWTDVLRQRHKVKVCWTIDTKRWKETLFSTLR